jgi:ubiquinone/menaquinone biosynthesis C-methylase UbiE
MSHGPGHERRFDPAELAKLDAPERQERMPPAAIVAAARPRAGMRVADIGAGAGYFSLALLGASQPPAEVHAVDVSAELLCELVRRWPTSSATRLICHEASAEKLPLPDASVDLVLLGSVFHELDDAPQALSEARRILARGGRILIVDWDIPPGATGAAPVGPPYNHRVPPTQVRTLLRRHGFADIEEHPGFRDLYALSASVV